LKEQSKSKNKSKSNGKSEDEKSGAKGDGCSPRNRLWRVLRCKVRITSSVLGMFGLSAA
jgi:hypothetical protein